jgi:hypothetical protein
MDVYHLVAKLGIDPGGAMKLLKMVNRIEVLTRPVVQRLGSDPSYLQKLGDEIKPSRRRLHL